MRILAGSNKYQLIEQPKTNTVRPTSQKIRAAIFDVLGDINGLAVLDLYAGSGAVGFEAISRGAAVATFVEADARVVAVIRRNGQKLQLTKAIKVIQRSVELWLHEANNITYELIFADPPYVDFDAAIFEFATSLLAPDGVMVLSHASKMPAPELKSLQLVQHKSYGDSALSFYKR